MVGTSNPPHAGIATPKPRAYKRGRPTASPQDAACSTTRTSPRRPTLRVHCATTPARIREAYVDEGQRGDRRRRRRDIARTGGRPARGRCRRPPRSARCGAAPAPDRPDGAGLRLHGPGRGRRHGARGDPRGTAARDRRRGRARARFRRRRLHSRGPADGTSRRRFSSSFRRPSASPSTRSLHYPEDSAGRRMQTEYIAVPPSWTVGHAIDYLRETDRSAGPVLRALCDRCRRPPDGRGRARPAAADEAPDRDLRADRVRASPRARDRRSGRGGAHVRALQSDRRAGGRRRRSGWSA